MATIHQSNCVVLLAVYNGMCYLEEQVSSILNQINVQITLVASVDKSTDGSEHWLNQLALSDSRVQVLPYGEQFGGAAKNFFRLIRDVDMNQFDYIAFADQDDYWYPDKLDKSLMILSKQYDGYSSNVFAFWPDGKKILINKAQPQRQWDFIFEAAGPGCTYVMTKQLMIDIKCCVLKNWDKIQCVSLHDWFCYAFARANDYQWFIDPNPSMLYRQHEHNQIGVNRGIEAYYKRFKQICNGWWLTQAVIIADLIGLKRHHFIKRWTGLRRKHLLILALYTFQCRRRYQDQCFFLLACLMLACIGCH